jgi:hypothetical protein
MRTIGSPLSSEPRTYYTVRPGESIRPASKFNHVQTSIGCKFAVCARNFLARLTVYRADTSLKPAQRATCRLWWLKRLQRNACNHTAMKLCASFWQNRFIMSAITW